MSKVDINGFAHLPTKRVDNSELEFLSFIIENDRDSIINTCQRFSSRATDMVIRLLYSTELRCLLPLLIDASENNTVKEDKLEKYRDPSTAIPRTLTYYDYIDKEGKHKTIDFRYEYDL